MKSSTKFKLVQTKIYQINSLLQGLSTFLPISFDREYTSICLCTIHGSIIDFRFRVKNQRLSLSEDYKDGDTFMENGILVERKYVDMTDDANILQRKQKWIPNNVAEYFFFDEFGFLSISEKKICECYLEFTEALKLIYSNIKSYYNKFA